MRAHVTPPSSVLNSAFRSFQLGSWWDQLRQAAARTTGSPHFLVKNLLSEQTLARFETASTEHFFSMVQKEIEQGIASRLPFSKPLLSKYWELVTANDPSLGIGPSFHPLQHCRSYLLSFTGMGISVLCVSTSLEWALQGDQHLE